MNLFAAASVAAMTAFSAQNVHACACGCGLFDVTTSSMLPEGPGGMVFTEVDYQNQYKNWSGSSRAPAANNDDKEIRTWYLTQGFQYFFNRSWGLQVQVPYDFRTFKTASPDPGAPPGTIVAPQWSGIGDMRIKGIYTGFSDDLSTGLEFGLKLPTGNFSHDPDVVDRDTQIGTGSTDLLLGVFHRQHFLNSWTLFAQAQAQIPMITQDQYRPGMQFDQVGGVYYDGWLLGQLQITPLAQVIVSERTTDKGLNAADPAMTGYQRISLSPGVEFDYHHASVYGDVEIPVFQHIVGNQLVSPATFKMVFSYRF